MPRERKKWLVQMANSVVTVSMLLSYPLGVNDIMGCTFQELAVFFVCLALMK